MADKPKAPAAPAPDTAGWWSCRDLSGSVAGVTAAIDANPDIPAHWKTALKAEIALRNGTEFNFVYLDAQFSMGKQGWVLDCHGVPDKKLL